MNPAIWAVDELLNAGQEHLDPVYVDGFDHKSGFDPAADLALLRRFGLGPDSTLVDLGAGTGKFALAAAAICHRVVAVDVSPAMLETMAERAKKLGVNNLELVQSGFLTFGNTREPVDFVYMRNALHHLPDFWKGVALWDIASMLRPKGVLRLRDLVFSFEPGETESVIEAWLNNAARNSDDGWTRDELATHVREEFSTFSWLLEPMLRHAGFEIADASYSDSRVYADYVCVKS